MDIPRMVAMPTDEWKKLTAAMRWATRKQSTELPAAAREIFERMPSPALWERVRQDVNVWRRHNQYEVHKRESTRRRDYMRDYMRDYRKRARATNRETDSHE
jgi:hypothetical protein